MAFWHAAKVTPLSASFFNCCLLRGVFLEQHVESGSKEHHFHLAAVLREGGPHVLDVADQHVPGGALRLRQLKHHTVFGSGRCLRDGGEHQHER